MQGAPRGRAARAPAPGAQLAGALTTRAMKALLAASLALTLAGCSTPTQIRLDRMVDELCAKDGGIRVYEVVQLPLSAFDERGRVKFDPAKKTNALGSDFIYDSSFLYLTDGLHQGHEAVVARIGSSVKRKSDGKLLGEAVWYRRSGGDLIQPNIGSSYACPPSPGRDAELFNRLFEMRKGAK